MKAVLAFLVTCVWLSGLALAEENEAVELTISPQAIEAPILKYHLLPTEIELKEGNAATILLKLPWDQMPYMDRVYPTLHDWSVRPLDAPEWADFTKEFVLPDNFYDVMKRAAYRRDADWEYPIDEPLPFILLPDLQGLRSFVGYGLTAKARYHLSRGELDQAREVILVGFANGRHVAQGPFLVSQVVAAVAIHSSMLDQTAQLIAQPNSPNLYWALSMLPESLLNTARAADLEADMLRSALPAARELDRSRDAAEWTRMADQLVEYLKYSDELTATSPEKISEERDRLTRVARRMLPDVLTPTMPSDRMINLRTSDSDAPTGVLPPTKPADRIANMSDDQVLVTWYIHARMALDDRRAAAFRLPPREAAAQFRQLDADATRFNDESGLQVSYATTRSQYMRCWYVSRKIQALRIVEAVRHHLASHEGRFPSELAEMTDLPIPLDPLTDQPFEWTVDRDANTALLKSPPISSDFGDPLQATVEYKLRVR